MVAKETTYSDIWQDCLARIKEQTSNDEFVKWFKPLVPMAWDGVTLQLRVPNESYVYHIEKNCLSFLRPILYQLFGMKTRLRYVMPKAEPSSVSASSDTNIGKFIAQTDTANIKNPFILPGIRKTVIDPQLNSNYTFDTFVEGECNRLARSAGMSVAVGPGTTPFNPLYIYGSSGLGKTHLAQAIGAEARLRNPEMQVLYVSMNRFQAQYTRAILNRELNDFIHFYQMIDVLIIDDIQELAGKEKTQNAFFNIFNHLQLAGKQLIITSDKAPVELKDIEQRLITRFKWGLSAQLTMPDFETKVKIIRLKAQRMGVVLTDDVVDFLAENINANVREIEGALSSLVANASFMGKKITPALAREILKVYVQFSHHEVTVDEIKKAVCEAFKVEMAALDSQRRTREIAQARQVAMWLSKKHTKTPLTAIGLAIGGKNHATVLHAIKAIDNLIATDKVLKQRIEELERRLVKK